MFLKVLKSFFCNSDGIFQPVYFWATIFLSQLCVADILLLFGVSVNSSVIIGGFSIIGILLGVYHVNKIFGGSDNEK